MRMWSILWFMCAFSLAGCGSPDPIAQRVERASSADPKTADESSATVGNPPEKNASSSQAANEEADGKLTLERLVFSVPEGWQRKPAASNFILAEFSLPKADGDNADGRLTVSTAGGSVEANISRWRDQFGGKPEKSSEEKKKVNDLEITVVDYTGEFNDQRGPFAPATKRSNHRMLAAVIQVDGELHFIKATGSQATIAAHVERFDEFLGSVKTR